MHQGKGDTLFQVCNYIILAVISLVCVYPFYYILLYSLSGTKAAAHGVYLIPKSITLDNYLRVLLNPGIAHSALISLERTIIGTLLTIVCCTAFGYVLTKRELPWRRIIYRTLVVTMYLNAGLIPMYMLFHQVGLINHFLVFVLPSAVSAYHIILIKTYIEQLPPALEESAMVDGANYWISFLRIVVPLCTPIIATVAVLNAVYQWNNIYDNIIFASNSRLETLQLQLYQILSNFREAGRNINTTDLGRNLSAVQPSSMTIQMTITMIATLPILFVYPFLQRYFVKGIMLGAVKG